MKNILIAILTAACLLVFFGGVSVFCAEEQKPATPTPLKPTDLPGLVEKAMAGDLKAADSLWQHRQNLAATSGKNLSGKEFDENSADAKLLAILASLGDTDAISLLLEYVSSSDKKLSEWAKKNIGEPVSKTVVLDQIKKLQSDKPKTRADAVFALGQLKDICALRPIIALVGDSAKEVRVNVAEALSELKSPLAVETAAQMAQKDSDPDTRVAAVNALVANNSTRTDVLVSALDDPDGYVRLAALAALKTFHDKNAIPKLLKLLEKPGEGLKGRQFTIVGSSQGEVVETKVNTLDERHLKIIANCANEALKAITGQDFDFDSYHTAGEQMTERAKWLKWWQENEKTFTVKPPAPKTK